MKRSSIFVGVTLLLLTLVASAAPAATITVQLIVIDFVEQDITIQVGDTVHWEWVSGTHNVVSGVGGVQDFNFDSGNPAAGTTFDVTFDQAFLDANSMPDNEYPYYCEPHLALGMIGTITVTAVASGCNTNSDCTDADLCNGTETCQSGACASGTALNCDDNNACTNDSCDATAGCQNVNDDTNTCDDGESCTSNDVCSAGKCVGTPTQCPSEASCCKASRSPGVDRALMTVEFHEAVAIAERYGLDRLDHRAAAGRRGG